VLAFMQLPHHSSHFGHVSLTSKSDRSGRIPVATALHDHANILNQITWNASSVSDFSEPMCRLCDIALLLM